MESGADKITEAQLSYVMKDDTRIFGTAILFPGIYIFLVYIYFYREFDLKLEGKDGLKDGIASLLSSQVFGNRRGSIYNHTRNTHA